MNPILFCQAREVLLYQVGVSSFSVVRILNNLRQINFFKHESCIFDDTLKFLK